MKFRKIDNQLEITTKAYQAKNGAIYLDWGNTILKLEKMFAENIARDIPDFNQDDFNNYYK